MANRALDENIRGLGLPEVIFPLLQMAEVRVRLADSIFTWWAKGWHFSIHYWQWIMLYVPERRQEAWEVARKHGVATLEFWLKWTNHFNAEAGREGEPLIQLSDQDWDYFWLAVEHIRPMENADWVKIATSSKKFAVEATKKLFPTGSPEDFLSVVEGGTKQPARVEAANQILKVTQDENVLVSIINHVPSLRREAARRLADLREV